MAINLLNSMMPMQIIYSMCMYCNGNMSSSLNYICLASILVTPKSIFIISVNITNRLKLMMHYLHHVIIDYHLHLTDNCQIRYKKIAKHASAFNAGHE